MEPAQTINECYYLKEINKLKDNIIELQKTLLEKNQIIEKDKEIIRDLQNKLKLQEQSKSLTTINPITPNLNFDIHKKEVIFKENCPGNVYSIYILHDGRLVSGDSSGNIIIYNSKDFKSEITIKESSYIMYLTQLNNGTLVVLLSDGSIKIYELLENYKYLCLQTIKDHTARVHKLRVLDNDDKRFMTCSDDYTIKFYFKDKNYYIYDYTCKDEIYIFNILRTREGEIAYLGYNSKGSSFIKFYDLKSRKIISSLDTKKQYNGLTDNMYKLNDKYLLVGATNSILIFDVNQHKQIREIESKNSNCITCFLKLDEKCLLSVDCLGNIKQWIIDEDNLILEKEKNKAHDGQIRMIRKNKDGLIITCSDDKSIKIWN